MANQLRVLFLIVVLLWLGGVAMSQSSIPSKSFSELSVDELLELSDSEMAKLIDEEGESLTGHRAVAALRRRAERGETISPNEKILINVYDHGARLWELLEEERSFARKIPWIALGVAIGLAVGWLVNQTRIEAAQERVKALESMSPFLLARSERLRTRKRQRNLLIGAGLLGVSMIIYPPWIERYDRGQMGTFKGFGWVFLERENLWQVDQALLTKEFVLLLALTIGGYWLLGRDEAPATKSEVSPPAKSKVPPLDLPFTLRSSRFKWLRKADWPGALTVTLSQIGAYCHSVQKEMGVLAFGINAELIDGVSAIEIRQGSGSEPMILIVSRLSTVLVSSRAYLLSDPAENEVAFIAFPINREVNANGLSFKLVLQNGERIELWHSLE